MNSIEPNRTALLVMDLQADIISRLGGTADPLLHRTADLIGDARRAKLTIIYVVVGFRPGYPEVSPRNPSFGAVSQAGRFTATPGSDIAPAVRPQEGDIVVAKKRVSAFAGSDLEMILRAKGIDTLVLTGLATSGVVLSTLRQAADSDYQLVVVKDCCGDVDEEVHRVLMEKVFPRQATVVTAEELRTTLRSA